MDGAWTLIVFTLFSQVAVGMVILQAMFGGERAVKQSCWKFVALIIFGMSFIASCFHITDMSASIFTITNIINSWLSREILGVGLFGGLLLLSCFIKQRMLLIFTAVAGAFLLYTTAYVYNVPQVEFWEIQKTLPLFISVGLCIGSTILFALEVLSVRKDSVTQVEEFQTVLYSWKPIAVILSFACQTVCTHVHLLSANKGMDIALLDTYSLLAPLGITGGFFFIVRAMFKQATVRGSNLIPCIHASAVVMVLLLFVAGLCNRILYFNEYTYFGM